MNKIKVAPLPIFSVDLSFDFPAPKASAVLSPTNDLKTLYVGRIPKRIPRFFG
jgi:hypothetical protein